MARFDDDDLTQIDDRLRSVVQSLDRFQNQFGQGRLDRMISTAFKKEERRLRRELNGLVKSALTQSLAGLGGGKPSSRVIDTLFDFIPGFARGGVLSRKTPLAHTAEAGPEAVLPLKKGPDGRLGVVAQHASSSSSQQKTERPVINITIAQPSQELSQAITTQDWDSVEAALTREIDQAIDARLKAHRDHGRGMGVSSRGIF